MVEQQARVRVGRRHVRLAERLLEALVLVDVELAVGPDGVKEGLCSGGLRRDDDEPRAVARAPRRLALVLDARLPMQTVYEVANTAAFSGFDDLMLVVDDATVERSTRLGARPAEEPPELPSTLVFFRPTTYALVGPESSQDVEVPCGGPCSDDNVPSNALLAQLTPLRAQVPSSHVVISPADTTSLTRLARTLVALRAGVEDGRGGELRLGGRR